jgi:hypothetical protein
MLVLTVTKTGCIRDETLRNWKNRDKTRLKKKKKGNKKPNRKIKTEKTEK